MIGKGNEQRHWGHAPGSDFEGIDFLMTALFVTIVIDQWKRSTNHFLALLGFESSIVFLLLVAAVCGLRTPCDFADDPHTRRDPAFRHHGGAGRLLPEIDPERQPEGEPRASGRGPAGCRTSSHKKEHGPLDQRRNRVLYGAGAPRVNHIRSCAISSITPVRTMTRMGSQ